MNTQNAADERNPNIENFKTRPLEGKKNELSFLDGSIASLSTDNKKNIHCPTKKGAAKMPRRPIKTSKPSGKLSLGHLLEREEYSLKGSQETV
jgi:hypothetical protein